jgi:hypothetical protein
MACGIGSCDCVLCLPLTLYLHLLKLPLLQLVLLQYELLLR